jgi:hypothetical protein
LCHHNSTPSAFLGIIPLSKSQDIRSLKLDFFFLDEYFSVLVVRDKIKQEYAASILV